MGERLQVRASPRVHEAGLVEEKTEEKKGECDGQNKRFKRTLNDPIFRRAEGGHPKSKRDTMWVNHHREKEKPRRDRFFHTRRNVLTRRKQERGSPGRVLGKEKNTGGKGYYKSRGIDDREG